MKFGRRTPSLQHRLSARTSVKRILCHHLGLKVPRGFGIVANPNRAIYNRAYNRTSFDLNQLLRKLFK